MKQAVRGLKYEAMKKIIAKAITCSESDEIRRLLSPDDVARLGGQLAASPYLNETVKTAVRESLGRDRETSGVTTPIRRCR